MLAGNAPARPQPTLAPSDPTPSVEDLTVDVEGKQAFALCQVVHWLRVWHLAAKRMPIRGAVQKPWRIKVARALIRSELRQSKATWDFAIIYLLYPVNRCTKFSTKFSTDTCM